MGKNNKIDLNDPEALKAQGNKAFAAGHFEEAIDWYSKAIEKNPKNHIYFANSKCLPEFDLYNIIGANAFLEIGTAGNARIDCDAAIALEPKFVKVSNQHVSNIPFSRGLEKQSHTRTLVTFKRVTLQLQKLGSLEMKTTLS